MIRQYSHSEPLNLRKSWWIRSQHTSYQHILILSCYPWFLLTQKCRLFVPFQMAHTHSNPLLILENLKFQASSQIHWIHRLLSLLKFKSSIPNLTSANSWKMSHLIKENQSAMHFQCQKTKKIKKFTWKLMKRDRLISQILYFMMLVRALIRFRQASRQNQKIIRSMCLSLTHSHQRKFILSLLKSCRNKIRNKWSFLTLKMKRTHHILAH